MRIEYDDIALGADADAETTATQTSSFSSVAQLPVGIDTVNGWTFEQNAFVLDGANAPVTTQAYWSSNLSGADGTFSTPPTITFEFDNLYTSLGLTLKFAPRDWCSQINVKWYKDTTVLADVEFYPNSSEFVCEQKVEQWNKIVITLKKTNVPGRFARLGHVIFGLRRKFEADEIRNGTVLLEISPSGEDAPISTLKWTLDSEKDVDFVFQRQQEMRAYANAYKKGEAYLGSYYVSSSKRKSKNVYEIECVDPVGVLDQAEFPGAYYFNETPISVLKNICSPFNALLPLWTGGNIHGIIKPCTKREALQQVCFALGRFADTSSSNYITADTLNTMSNEIPDKDVFIGGQLSKSALVTKVILVYRDYTTTEPESGTEYDTYTIGGVKYYGIRHTISKEYPDMISTDVQNEVLIEDATLVTSSNAQTVLDGLYDFYQRRDSYEFSEVYQGYGPGAQYSVPSYAGSFSGHVIKAKILMSNLTVSETEVLGLG